MDEPGAIIFSSSNKKGHKTILIPLWECPMKKLYVSWIVEQLDIDASHEKTKIPEKGKIKGSKY
jgi:hypothetical protein